MHTATGVSRVSLREFFPHSHIFGSPDIRVASCCDEARRCRPGDLYVAVTTADDDGHETVDEALRRGADAVLAERQLPIAAPVCVVPDSREAYGRLCQRLAGDPSGQMRTVGITGTNGKTTTAWLLDSIFRTAGVRNGLISSLAHSDGLDRTAACRTTPPAGELASWLGRMAEHDCGTAVVEVSSRALAERRTAGVEFDVAVLTNVRRDHLDYHGTIFNYRRIKSRLFEHLKPDGAAVVNADDAASKFVLRNLHRPVLTVGMHAPAELTATVVERHPCEQTFLLTAGDETAAVQTRMFGDHHVYNCLGAAAVGLLMGLDLTTVARGLEAVTMIPGRLEPVVAGQPFGVYIDAAHSPDALSVALRSLRQVTSGRVICVYGAAAHGDPSQRPLLGRVAERMAHLGVITSDRARGQEPLQIVHDILDGYDRPARAHVLPGRVEAIRWALSQARPGDAVLIAGKGGQPSQAVRSQPGADDRLVARQWLYEVGSHIDYEEEQPRVISFASRVPQAN
ncbi:MAG: UDP-N-acetylmuramoyl-L-alanyl-D-glutamate--2,6-diaminopimelate ligase [Candidatus Anammoximicrobium sp.]|nr:UDP-N-acetylmuramoyl-L-alanyl-D-glutamate--2,6-diaminopimelate ligase [Candidatus Anammoximicrobium sp.]